MTTPNTLKKYTKKQLCNIIEELDNCVDEARRLRVENQELEKGLYSFNNSNKELLKEIENLKKSNKELLKSKQNTINSLFDIYSTVLLEDNWNDRIDWKNDLLQSIQLLIQDIS